MLTVAIPKRNKLQNIIVLTPKDGVRIIFLHNKKKKKKTGPERAHTFPGSSFL